MSATTTLAVSPHGQQTSRAQLLVCLCSLMHQPSTALVQPQPSTVIIGNASALPSYAIPPAALYFLLSSVAHSIFYSTQMHTVAALFRMLCFERTVPVLLCFSPVSRAFFSMLYFAHTILFCSISVIIRVLCLTHIAPFLSYCCPNQLQRPPTVQVQTETVACAIYI